MSTGKVKQETVQRIQLEELAEQPQVQSTKQKTVLYFFFSLFKPIDILNSFSFAKLHDTTAFFYSFLGKISTCDIQTWRFELFT